MAIRTAFRVLQRDWRDSLGKLFSGAKHELTVVTPFVTAYGTKFLDDNVSGHIRSNGRVRFVTDLSPLNVCTKATDPSALVTLLPRLHSASVTHLPGLHAKVYLADSNEAIVTSGNLTTGGLLRNYEYGVAISDAALVTSIRDDIDDYATLGVDVSEERLEAYARTARELVNRFENRLRSARRELQAQFELSYRAAEDELVALRLSLSGGAITAVFEKTMTYLLRKHGALSTKELHPMIQNIHPDLCDDSVDRVINGQHFGKRWKHVARSAQSHLKARGLIELEGGVWRLTQRVS